MCGRYYIEIDERELRNIINEVEKNVHGSSEQLTLKTSGEIFPTDIVPVQTGLHQYTAMKWGFSGFDGRPVINARSETALDKPMFQKAMLERRCLIPASGYYEWRKDGNKKIKHRFFIPGTPMCFAACYRHEQNSALPSFVILTKQAVGGLEAIHDRMPIIIPPEHAKAWLYESPGNIEYAVRELLYEAV